jgi:uncharacterized protein DUF1552
MMRNWNRREFTRNAAMLTLFSPFINMLVKPSTARAQAAAGPAKYLLIMTSNGTDPGVWQPSGGPGAVSFSEMTQPLSAISGDVTLANKFDSRGTAGSHGAIGGLTGNNWGNPNLVSLDFFVADDLRKRGIITQVPSLHLGGVNGQPGLGFKNNNLQAPQFSTSEAFRTIFDGAAPAAPPPTTTPGTPAAPAGPDVNTIKQLRRQSVLDVVRGDITQLQNSFGGLEREKLQIHIQSIQDLESRIAQNLAIAEGSTTTPVAGGGVGGPTQEFVKPVSCSQPNATTGLQPVENSAIHMELATAAFACDITRVAHVEFGHHQSCPVDIPGAKGDWHNDFMHASQNRAPLIATEQFVSQQLVNAVARLKATPAPDGNGTLYSQTFILWVREMGDAVVHAGTNMPFVIAGGAGGYLRGGQYLDGGGAFHLRVLMAAAEAMGVQDVSGFGAPVGSLGATAADRTPFDRLKA